MVPNEFCIYRWCLSDFFVLFMFLFVNIWCLDESAVFEISIISALSALYPPPPLPPFRRTTARFYHSCYTNMALTCFGPPFIIYFIYLDEISRLKLMWIFDSWQFHSFSKNTYDHNLICSSLYAVMICLFF